MAKQKLSPKARAAKKKRDLAFAKPFDRKRKKAEKNSPIAKKEIPGITKTKTKTKGGATITKTKTKTY